MAKRQIVLIVSALLLGSSLVLVQPNANSQQKGPEHPLAAQRVDFEETFHGVRLNDRYHWLENFDDPAAAAWIDAQDRYARTRRSTAGWRFCTVERASTMRAGRATLDRASGCTAREATPPRTRRSSAAAWMRVCSSRRISPPMGAGC
jgi:hypothetical protein